VEQRQQIDQAPVLKREIEQFPKEQREQP
jgi:hypothetical protein